MRWKEIREGVAAQRAHARQSRPMLEAIRSGETAVEQVCAAWEAGQPVRDARELAALVSAQRSADREATG
jgi:hypothetical protein